ncbi:hypothetical protein WNY81_08610 [Shewanella frigidimarina]|uniref:hypothetical protein n=1 Tax=Shewanella frigidimarina TaxID=56812 RepID=UPI0031767270
MRFYILGFLLVISSNVSAVSIEEMRAITLSVTELCRGGSSQGYYKNLDVNVDGTIKTVVIKKLAEAGASAEFKFNKHEWEGIEPILAKNVDSKAHTVCVSKMVDIFSEKLDDSKKDGDKISACNAKLKCDHSSYKSMKVCLEVVDELATEQGWPESTVGKAEIKCYSSMGKSVKACYPGEDVKLSRATCEEITNSKITDH